MDLLQLHAAFIVLMPAIVTFVAGAIRQDAFPRWLNELLTLLVIALLSLTQALLDGKLGGSPIADFTLVAGYVTAMMHTPLFQQLQSAAQTHVLNVGGSPAQPAPTVPAIDLQALAGQFVDQLPIAQLATMLKAELVKDLRSTAQPGQAPRVDQVQTQVTPAVQPTAPAQPPNKAG